MWFPVEGGPGGPNLATSARPSTAWGLRIADKVAMVNGVVAVETRRLHIESGLNQSLWYTVRKDCGVVLFISHHLSCGYVVIVREPPVLRSKLTSQRKATGSSARRAGMRWEDMECCAFAMRGRANEVPAR